MCAYFINKTNQAESESTFEHQVSNIYETFFHDQSETRRVYFFTQAGCMYQFIKAMIMITIFRSAVEIN